MADHAPNVVHFAIHAADLSRARRFYERVFGWRFEAWGPPDFFRIHTGTTGDPGIEGALERRHEPLAGGSTGFTCTIAVADVAATRRVLEEAGGKVTYAGEIPTVGSIVQFEDPEGNVVSAMQYEPAHLEDMRRGR
jgi:predicted enzyme related to lactoylglutathione lyase